MILKMENYYRKVGEYNKKNTPTFFILLPYPVIIKLRNIYPYYNINKDTVYYI